MRKITLDLSNKKRSTGENSCLVQVFGGLNCENQGAELSALICEWLRACTDAEHGASYAVQRVGYCPRETAGRHHRGCELRQPSVLLSEACCTAQVEKLWREVAAVGHKDCKIARRRINQPARLPHRCSIEEPASRRCGCVCCGQDVEVFNAVSTYGRNSHHSHRNVGHSRHRRIRIQFVPSTIVNRVEVIKD